ncbi:MAG: 4Fe-4S binding protein [Bacillota bacterium]
MTQRIRRKVISIDEEKCTGCGLCVPDCPEGALQVIDGKARLISEPLCDGLGACLGGCPEGAITIVEKEAVPYDEKQVMANIVRQGDNVLKAHLEHLRDHGQTDYLREALEFLREKNLPVPHFIGAVQKRVGALEFLRENNLPVPPGFEGRARPNGFAACPCSGNLGPETVRDEAAGIGSTSSLRNWPVQLHLVQPAAPHFRQADLLLAADCVAYALGDFHRSHLPGKALAIACPKLDARQDLYPEKLKAFLNEAGIRSLTVMTMEVPCCAGLLTLAKSAWQDAGGEIPLRSLVVGTRGGSIRETIW